MKRTSLLCLAILIPPLATGCLYALTYKPLPKVEGRVAVPGLQDEVRIVRDASGVPHIFASNEEDSLLALGYVHAQDRLWQIDMMRHLAEGRLSEVVGKKEIANPLFTSKTTFDLDRYNRVLGFRYLAEQAIRRLDPSSLRRLELYGSGVNACAEQNADRLPAEFVLLGHSFERWGPEDTAALYLYIAWSLTDDWKLELLRYVLAAERGVDRAWEILPPYSDPGPYILEDRVGKEGDLQKDPPAAGGAGLSTAGSTAGIAELLRIGRAARELGLAAGFPAASNNWVVSGTKTVTGKPFLCNDPHLPLTVPSIWYQIHLHRPGMDVSGVMFPGTPVIAIGHNRTIAWGNTSPFEDSVDVFLEKANPGKPDEYLYKGESRKFESRSERICWREGGELKCEEIPVRMTAHGPVVNDLVPALATSGEPLVLKWSAYDLDFREKGLKMLTIGEATNWEEFRQHIDIGIPIFNWVYADVAGNIGYVAPGLIPVRGKGDGTYPVPGWTGEYDWQGYVPLDDMPRTFNPDKGFVVTANNHIFPEGAYPYVFSKRFMPSYRAARIRELLLEREKLDVEDMRRIQADVWTKQGERLARYFVEAYESAKEKSDPTLKRAAEALKGWDFRCTLDSVGATIFHAAYRFALENTFKDEMSSEAFEMLEDEITIEVPFDNLLEEGRSDLFDDRRTEAKETRGDILLKSLEDAVALLKRELGADVGAWHWGKIHTLEMEHVTFGQVGPLGWLFNVGEFPMVGSRSTIDNAFYPLSNKERFKTFVGSSYRQIIDMSDTSQMLAILPTGESGQRMSDHYADQTLKWLKVEFNELEMDLEKIEETKEGELVLGPER